MTLMCTIIFVSSFLNAQNFLQQAKHIINSGEEFVVDTNVVYIPETHEQLAPAVASDGTNCLVVWYDRRAGVDNIYCARVDQSGTVTDPEGIYVAQASYHYYIHPAVAFGDTNYLIVWANGKVSGARVTQSGFVLDPEEFVISSSASSFCNPSVAFDGSNYFVVWTDSRNGYDYDIYGARVSVSGIVLDTAGIPVCTAPNEQGDPDVSFDGTNYFVVWNDSRNSSGPDIYGARVSRSGIVLDTSGVAISTARSHQNEPSITFGSTDYLVVWSDLRIDSLSYDIYGARVTQSGDVLDSLGIIISSEIRQQYETSVSYDGSNFFVVWRDFRTGGQNAADIYGTRVNQAGSVLDTSGIAISAAIGYEESPSVSSCELFYLVVWGDARNNASSYDIYGARVDEFGYVHDSLGFPISTMANSQYSPAAAFDGTNYFVAWEDNRNYVTTESDIFGIRISQSGSILDTSAIAISAFADSQRLPTVTFGNTNYLVAWQDMRNSSLFSYDIYGARVDTSGVVIDTEGVAISSRKNYQSSPSIAFDGTNFFVVWHDNRTGSYDIYAARVSESGTVLDTAGIPISTANFYQQYPSVTFDGEKYFVVWQDNRDGPFDIHGARVSVSGEVLDVDGIVISTASHYQTNPSVAFDGTNYLVVWQDNRCASDYDIYGARVSQSGAVIDSSGIPISTGRYDQREPSISFNGTNYIVVWQAHRNDTTWDIYGAEVSPSGEIITSYPISERVGNQIEPALVRGDLDQVLITYAGWADSVYDQPVDTMRIWGKFYPFVGIIETEEKTVLDQWRLEIYPNPFRQMTDIGYVSALLRKAMPRIWGEEAKGNDTSLKIYDASGRLVRQFDNKTIGLSDHIFWFGTDNAGHKLPAGIYFIHLEFGNCNEIEKVVMLR